MTFRYRSIESVKDVRYLIRVAQKGTFVPSQQADLLSRVRSWVSALSGKAINLRVSSVAVEFDLFIPEEVDVQHILPVLSPLGEVLTCKRLDLPPPTIDPTTVVSEARHLFNEYRFWEVHEVLEGLWKNCRGTEKELVQGLIIAAAALVHVQKDEWGPVWTMLADAMRRLAGAPESYYGWDVARFRNHFARVLEKKVIEIPTV